MRCDNTGTFPARLAYLATGGRSSARNFRPLRDAFRDEPLFEELESRQMMTGDIAITGVYMLPGMTAFEGASVTASVNYRNAGTFLTDPATLRIVLSDNSTYGDADDVVIFNGANNAIGGLPIGASQHVTTSTFMLDTNMARAGIYYLIAHMTPSGVDLNSANNTFYSPTRFVVTVPAPAVELSNTTTITGGTFQPGQTITGTITARNNGTVAIGEAALVRFALSVDSIWGNEDDIEVTSPTGAQFDTLPAGTSSTAPLSFLIPGNTPNGTFRLISMIDWDRDFPETNEANNAYVQPVTVTIARPDLQGTITGPATMAAGSVINPTFTIRNAGGAATGVAHFTIALRPLGAPDASTDIVLLGNGYIPALVAGASSTMATGSITVGAGVPAGQYRTVLLLDVLTEVPESNEPNNTIVASTITTVTNPGPAALPDLTISLLPITRTLVPGDVLDPFIRVGNRGASGGPIGDVRMFLSTNSTLDASDVPIGSFVSPTGSFTIEFQPGALVPTWMPGGNYYLIAQADSDGDVTESNETNNTVATATASIIVVRPTISITASDPTAAEVTAPGTLNTGAFTITRTGPTTAPLVVNYLLSGTATEAADFGLTSHFVMIPAGALSATVVISPNNDTTGEPTETVIATLARGTGYSINLATNRATVNIADNEPVVTVAATDPTATETTAPTLADGGRFTFTRTGPTTSALFVLYSISGTADGTDFTGLTGNVTIPAGATSTVVNVAPINDIIGEAPETLIVTITPVDYSAGAAATATVTINDNEPLVTVTATDAAAAQTREGTPLNPGQFRFTRTGPTTDPLTVNYSIAGTASNGLDYRNADTDLALTNQVIIPAGQASVVVNIAPRVVARAGPITVILTPTFGAGELYRVATPAVAATVTIATLPPVNLAIDGFQTGNTPVSVSAPHATTSFDYVFYRAGLPATLAPFTVQIRLSSNNILGDADDIVVFTRAYAAGFSDSGLVSGNIDWDTLPLVVPGTYRLGLFLDNGGVINELNEVDNRGFSETGDLVFTP
ncbi:MAG: CARDB domain-containing protein [Phycisphaerales bacterium]